MLVDRRARLGLGLASAFAIGGCFGDPGAQATATEDGTSGGESTSVSTSATSGSTTSSVSASATGTGTTGDDSSEGTGSSDDGSTTSGSTSDDASTGSTSEGSSESGTTEGVSAGTSTSDGTTGTTGTSDDSGDTGATDTGDECTVLDARDVACGNCGLQTEVCGPDGQWTPVGGCSGEGECGPGDQDAGASCGDRCGVLSRTCDDTCTWSDWVCGDEGECTPMTMEMEQQGCGACGEVQSREHSCDETCHWGEWTDWSMCVSGAMCDDGEIDQEDRSCGNCGTESRTRTCDVDGCAFGEWSDWSMCANEGECSAGLEDSQVQFCGTCAGTQTSTRACTNDCAWPLWGPWGPCGPCASSFRVEFNTFPDGSSVASGYEIAGDEWSVLGIEDISPAPSGSYCSDTEGTQVRSSGSCGGIPKSLAGRRNDANPTSCTSIPIRIDFNIPVKSVELEVYGGDVTFDFKAYTSGGALITSTMPVSVCDAAATIANLTSVSANISYVVFGKDTWGPGIFALTWSTN